MGPEIQNYHLLRPHDYAVGNVAQHLRISHSDEDVEERAVITASARYDSDKPKIFRCPPPLREPFQELGKPVLAFICKEPECERISITRYDLRKHCDRAHDWKWSKEYPDHWHRVWLQTSFKTAGLQRYFTVGYTEQEQDGCSQDEEGTSIGRIAMERVEVDIQC